MSDDAQNLRSALGAFGYTPPEHDRTVTSEADAFARKLAGGNIAPMAAPTGPYEGAREQPKFATIPHTIMGGGALPPPLPPGGGDVMAPNPHAVERQRAMMQGEAASRQLAALRAQRPAYAAIPSTLAAPGAPGAPLPPPMPPQGVGPAPYSPDDVAAFRGRLAGDSHCDCKAKV